MQLTWSTTQEVNSDRFEIERSKNMKDWSNIGTVSSNGESTTLKEYSNKDLTPEKGQNLYRLKMIDKDGTFAFSRVRSLNWESASNAFVYPNPVIDRVYLDLDGSKEVASLQVIDASGKPVLTSVAAVEYVDVKSLPTGLYILKVTFQDGSANNFKFLRGK